MRITVLTGAGISAESGLATFRAVNGLWENHRIEEALGDDLLLVTQNVDDLHERAGSPDVIHMHGALTGALCAACGHRWPAPAVMAPQDPCPACARPATRPDIVWFGEMPYNMERIWDALEGADLFAAIGTSGNVYPAAGFAQHARRRGADCVELNLEASVNARDFHRRLIGPASRIVPDWVASLG